MNQKILLIQNPKSKIASQHTEPCTEPDTEPKDESSRVDNFRILEMWETHLPNARLSG